MKWKSLSHIWPFAIPWLYSPWNFPGQNAGVGSLSLLRRIFPTRGSNSGLPHCGWILYWLGHKGSPIILEWVAYPFSRRSSWPRNWTGSLLHCRWILYQLSYEGSLWLGEDELILVSRKISELVEGNQLMVISWRLLLVQWWANDLNQPSQYILEACTLCLEDWFFLLFCDQQSMPLSLAVIWQGEQALWLIKYAK